MINLPDQFPKKQNPNDFSGYTSSALNEGPTETYQPPQEFNDNEETYTEREDKKERTGMRPATPRYEEPPAPQEQTRMEIPSAPIYPEYPPTPSVDRIRKEEVEALIEQIIEEKWDALTVNVGDISIWKERVRTEVISIKQELLRLEHRFEELNKAVLGKVKDYDKSVRTVGTDVKAIEKVLQKILPTLTTNIKELKRVTEKLKK